MAVTMKYLGFFLLSIATARAAPGRELWDDHPAQEFLEVDVLGEEGDSCTRQMARVYRDDVITPYPPVISGEWTSIRCEARPGPEFLLRKYLFYDGAQFLLYQFYYQDSDCKEPLYGLVSRGSYSVFQSSWILSGATDLEYELNQVTLIPYTDAAASVLASKVNKTCPGYVKAPWRQGDTYDVFNFFEVPRESEWGEEEAGENAPLKESYLMADLDCLDALSFSLHELQNLRLEQKLVHHRMEQKLYLGDIHTQASERRTYRPTGFQDPLLLTHQVRGCPTCDRIKESNELNPPNLPHHHHPNFDLTGSWFSERCETRPNGVFVTRHLSFTDDQKTWEGYYHHFLDGKCQRPMYTLFVRGKMAVITKSKKIKGAFEVDFKVMQASIKPADMKTVALLNQAAAGEDRCGSGTYLWDLNREHDITETNGCRALDIKLPHVEFEIVKLETKHKKMKLFLGQRPTVDLELEDASPQTRPTSFQSPLVRCSDDMTAVTPSYHFHPLVDSPSGASATSTWRAVHIVLLFTGLILKC